jgi:hypothetical protein
MTTMELLNLARNYKAAPAASVKPEAAPVKESKPESSPLVGLKKRIKVAKANVESMKESAKPIKTDPKPVESIKPTAKEAPAPKPEPKVKLREKKKEVEEPVDEPKEEPVELYIRTYKGGFIVFGDTIPVKDTIKKLGGRFNANLHPFGEKSTVPGWVFKPDLRESVEKFLKSGDFITNLK